MVNSRENGFGITMKIKEKEKGDIRIDTVGGGYIITAWQPVKGAMLSKDATYTDIIKEARNLLVSVPDIVTNLDLKG